MSVSTLLSIAQEFSPRYERHRDDLVSIDVRGLERLVGTARTIGEEIRREAAARGVGVHVALAATRMAALVLAQARPGLTLVEPGREAAALAPLPIGPARTHRQRRNDRGLGSRRSNGKETSGLPGRRARTDLPREGPSLRSLR